MFCVSRTSAVTALAFLVGAFSLPSTAHTAIDTTPIVNIPDVASVKVFEFNGLMGVGNPRFSDGNNPYSTDGMTFGKFDPRLTSQTALPASYDYVGTPATEERFDIFYSNQNGILDENGNCITVRATSPRGGIRPGWTSFNLGSIRLLDATGNSIRHFDEFGSSGTIVGGQENYQHIHNGRAINGVDQSATTIGRTDPGQEMSLTLCLSAPEWVGNQQGMTFQPFVTPQYKYPSNPDIVHVGCWNGSGEVCGSKQGDTACSTPLPLLCILPGTAPKPPFVLEPDWKQKWSGGTMALSSPAIPAPTTRAAANAICQSTMGNSNARVAEFHDGKGWIGSAATGWSQPPNYDAGWTGGWTFSAKALNFNHNQTGKFWVDINDQPNAVCWQ